MIEISFEVAYNRARSSKPLARSKRALHFSWEPSDGKDSIHSHISFLDRRNVALRGVADVGNRSRSGKGRYFHVGLHFRL